MDQVVINAEEGWIQLSFETSLYPLDAVYGAAYIFIDRCYVFLDVPEADRISVQLRLQPNTSGVDLDGMAGEFANELLSQAWRHRITEQNRPIIEAVTAQAFRGAGNTTALSDLDDLDFTDDAFDDPLGIALSWEEKYGKDPVGPAVEGTPKGPPPAHDEGAPSQPEREGVNSTEDGQDG